MTITLDEEAVEAVALAAAELVRAELSAAGFLDVNGAAEFLACPPSRIYALTSARRLPHFKDGSRLLFDPEALRDYVRAGGAYRP